MDRLRGRLSGITGEHKLTREQEMEMEPRAMSCDRLAKMEVTSAQGEKLGKVEEIMLDFELGRLFYAMVSLEGIPGAGSKLFAIPWEAFSMSTAREKLILNIPRERLQFAPGVDKSDWHGEPGRGWVTSVYSYYGYAPYWTHRNK